MIAIENHYQNSASATAQNSSLVVQQDSSLPSNMSQCQSQTQNLSDDSEAAEKSSKIPSREEFKSAVSQRSIALTINKTPHMTKNVITKEVLKLDLPNDLQSFPDISPKFSVPVRMPHQTSLTSSADVENRKTLRETLYQGIFHRHRRTIFAVGSFLRMLRTRNSQYNTIRSSSEGEDMEGAR